jgi:hypothetical protein
MKFGFMPSSKCKKMIKVLDRKLYLLKKEELLIRKKKKKTKEQIKKTWQRAMENYLKKTQVSKRDRKWWRLYAYTEDWSVKRKKMIQKAIDMKSKNPEKTWRGIWKELKYPFSFETFHARIQQARYDAEEDAEKYGML